MIKRYTSVILNILVLAGIVAGSALWLQAFYTSIRSYRSPLRTVELAPQLPTTPSKTTRVVVALIGGLGLEASNTLDLLPVLEQLRRAGASLAVESIPPTYSQTARATLITGAPPETNDAPPVDVPPEALHLLRTDTIFARAHDARLKTALLGPAPWRYLIPRNQLDHTFFVDKPGAEADEAILEAALPLVKQGDIELIVIHFSQVNVAAQSQGGTKSEAYQQAALAVDEHLGRLSATIDLSHNVLAVMADHGHIPDGGHGGAEVEVIWQPLVLIGENIIPGSYSDVYQTDVVPTISALLGLAPPTAAQGRILYELLWFGEHDRAATQLLLAQQRVALAEAYTAQIRDAPVAPVEALEADLTQAQSSLASNNISGAFQLARLAQEEADDYMATVRNSRLQAEKRPRLAAALVVTVAWFYVMWQRRGPHAGSILIAVLITFALYHILFQLQGYSYSVSSLKEFSEIPLEVARRTGLSLLAGGGILLALLMLSKEENWLTLLGACYGFGILVTFIFALPVLWAFWHNGFVVDWRLPEVVPAFWQATGLLETMVAAALGLFMPWPIMSVSLLINLIRSLLSDARTQTDSDALPGLHL